MIARASPSGIVLRIGRIFVVIGRLPRSSGNHLLVQLLNDVPEFRQDQSCHRQADGVLGSWQDEDGFTADGAGAGAAEHRCGADFLERQHPEQLAEAVELFFQQPIDRLECPVARGDPGATGRDDDTGVVCGKRLRDQRRDLVGFVANDRGAADCMPLAFEQLANRPPARVGLRCPSVADRDDEAVHARWRRTLVFTHAHGQSPGIIMCAADVPASISQAPPCWPLSGSPVDAAVAPGSATVLWARARSLSGPRSAYQTDPYSGFARVPFFSAASIAACRLARSGSASNRRFCVMRSRLAILLHSTENGCWPGSLDESKQTSRFVPLRRVS